MRYYPLVKGILDFPLIEVPCYQKKSDVVMEEKGL